MNDLLFLTGGHCGVVGAWCHDRAVPPGVGPKGIWHQSEGRGSAQALALHVCRDGEGLCVGDEGPSSLPPSQPCKALRDQVKRTKGSLLDHTHTHTHTHTHMDIPFPGTSRASSQTLSITRHHLVTYHWLSVIKIFGNWRVYFPSVWEALS